MEQGYYWIFRNSIEKWGENMNKVLIVDDDMMLLKMAEELLKKEYEVTTAKSGKEAINLVSGVYVPDVILLDINMPKMNGYETLKKLREISEDIPVIFLTGLYETEFELKGLKLGAVDYIIKPFVKEILFARLKIRIETGKKSRDYDPEKLKQLDELLTDTERAIAKLMAYGYTNTEIAGKLNYSYNYVKKVITIIFEKLDINKRNEIRKFLI
jgi:DNA-binding NarL/FixJ family response regulator